MLKTIDIGHSNFYIDEAITVLETTVSQLLQTGNVRAVKVIHGLGKGALRRAVREWCAGQAGRFQAVIPGEDYDLFNPDAVNMRLDCGLPKDDDLGKTNPAITYIWLR